MECTEPLGVPSSLFNVTPRDLIPDEVAARFTRGTGSHTIENKLTVSQLPVQSGTVLAFDSTPGLTYRALLYELRHKATNQVADVSPNWFGVAIPDPNTFDLSRDVYVIIYFHPRPGQAGYSDADYFNKTGAQGTDWKQLYAYVDRLGGQMAGAIRAQAPANRVVVFPFLKNAQYTLATGEWFNVIHDILQDINRNLVRGICTRPKKVIVATLSNGTVYLDKFLDEAAALPIDGNIIEAWDFDTEIVQGQNAPLDPHGKRLRAYWQAREVPASTSSKTYLSLPSPAWANFPQPPSARLLERPPLPPHPSNSVGTATTSALDRVHHYIRDTMFLDAVFNIENDNP